MAGSSPGISRLIYDYLMQLDPNAMKGLGRVTGFGLTMVAAMMIFGAAGLWLDGKFNTTPVLGIVLFLIGGAGALAYAIIGFQK